MSALWKIKIYALKPNQFHRETNILDLRDPDNVVLAWGFVLLYLSAPALLWYQVGFVR